MAQPWLRFHLCGVLPWDDCRYEFYLPPRLYMHTRRHGSWYVNLPLPFDGIDRELTSRMNDGYVHRRRRVNWPPTLRRVPPRRG